jgi:enoyl-CoA hydratase/carnithine racemase
LREAGLRLEMAGPLATVILDRPERRNAQGPPVWHALADIGRALPGDVRAVLLRAEGPSFSAGLDRELLDVDAVRSLASRPDDEALAVLAGYQEAFRWWRRPSLLTVAAVQGHALGAGLQLALACDLRIAADDAVLALPEVTLGLVPDLGGTGRLVDLVGPARALELCATGRRLDAVEAHEWGLVNAVVPPAELAAAGRDLVAAVLEAQRDAVVEIKALVTGAGSRSAEAQCEAERHAQLRRLRALCDLDAD